MTMFFEDSKTGGGTVSAVLPAFPEMMNFVVVGHPLVGLWSAINRMESFSIQPGKPNHNGMMSSRFE